MTEGEFVGKKVLVTGAAGGLGAALVKTFEDRGADIILCERSVDALQAPRWPVHAFDLLDAVSIEGAVRDILAKHGAPDVVVNNAGWTRAETFGDLTSKISTRKSAST